jgi:hypothetical protein
VVTEASSSTSLDLVDVTTGSVTTLDAPVAGFIYNPPTRRLFYTKPNYGGLWTMQL